jgi:hypothetical protein
MRILKTLLLAAVVLPLAVRCGVTAKAALEGTTEEAATCAAQTLASLGYDVVDAPEAGPIRAERTDRSRLDVDRVIAQVDNHRLRVVGITLRQASVAGFGNRTMSGGRGPVQSGDSSAAAEAARFPSRELRNDVHTVVTACGSAP